MMNNREKCITQYFSNNGDVSSVGIYDCLSPSVGEKWIGNNCETLVQAKAD